MFGKDKKEKRVPTEVKISDRKLVGDKENDTSGKNRSVNRTDNKKK